MELRRNRLSGEFDEQGVEAALAGCRGCLVGTCVKGYEQGRQGVENADAG